MRDIIAHHGVFDEGIHFVAKPFTLDTLATRAREVVAKAGREEGEEKRSQLSRILGTPSIGCSRSVVRGPTCPSPISQRSHNRGRLRIPFQNSRGMPGRRVQARNRGPSGLPRPRGGAEVEVPDSE